MTTHPHPRLIAVLVTIAMSALLVPGLAVAGPPGGRATVEGGWATFESEAGARDYFVQAPRGGGKGRPLVVFLHGCGGVATDHLARSGFADLALRERLVVVAPQQIDEGCWDWMNEDHQHRGAGEPSIIAGITQLVANDFRADPSRVYIGGLSAGAIMTTIMGAAYPDRYAAIFSAAGCAYDTCTDVTGQAAYDEMGPRARAVPAVFLQGTLDPLSNYAVGRLAVNSWLATNDLADDGAANGSVGRVPTSREDHLPERAPDPDRYPDCAAISTPPDGPHAGCLVGLDRFPYTVEHFPDQHGEPLVDLVTVHGMGHHFTSPVGPDIAAEIWTWLRPHALDECSPRAPRRPTC